MKANEYQQAAIRTECDQDKSIARMSMIDHVPEDPLEMIRLNHAFLGLAAEAGELISLLLKVVYYGKPFTEEMRLKMVEELGDAQWFIAQACTVLGVNLEDVMKQNIAKLKARFPDKFTEELSANRDEEKERQAMVSSTVSIGSEDNHMHHFVGDDAINSKCKICGKTLKNINKERIEREIQKDKQHIVNEQAREDKEGK